MNLAILTSSIAPYPVSGAERQAAATAVRFARMGYRVTVFARHMLPEQPSVVERDGVRWVRCRTIQRGGLRFPSHVLSFLRAWDRESARQPFDCILAYQMVISGVLGRLASRRSRVPLVYWVRSEQEIRLRRSRKHRWFSPLVLGGCSHVLTQADNILKDMLFELRAVGKESLAAHVETHASVLANAVELPPEPAYHGRRGLVCVGRLVQVKGVHVLLEALREFKDPPPLHVMGDGPMRDELERSAQGLPVTFHGYCEEADVARRLGEARVLVSPSFVEGFPNAILEGMAHGTPPVATPVGGVPSLVRDGENGLFVPAGDVRALAEGVKRLLDDDGHWKALAEEARRTATGYAWEPHMKQLDAVLRHAIVA